MKNLDLIKEEQAEQALKAEEQKKSQEAAQHVLDEIKDGKQSIYFEPVTANTAQREDKLFTQDEVNRFIKDRLTKDRTKAAQSAIEQAQQLDGIKKELEQRENELGQRQHRLNIALALHELNLPTHDTMIDFVMADNMDAVHNKIQAFCSLKSTGIPELEEPKDPIKEAMNIGN